MQLVFIQTYFVSEYKVDLIRKEIYENSALR